LHGSQIKWVRLALDMTLMSNSISLTCVPSGYYLCSASTAATAIAGAVYGTVSSVAVTLLSCCIIGKPRTIRVREHGLQESVSGYIRCGNRAQINTTAQRYYRDSFFSGSQTEHSSGDVYTSSHGVGLYWSPISGSSFGFFSSSESSRSAVVSNSYSMGTGLHIL
jgi:hypothetical protein